MSGENIHDGINVKKSGKSMNLSQNLQTKLQFWNSQFHVIPPCQFTKILETIFTPILDPILETLHLISELDHREGWLNWGRTYLNTNNN